MNIKTIVGPIEHASVDVIAVSALEDGGPMGGAVKDVDVLLNHEIRDAMKASEFSGARGTTLVIRTHGRLGARFVVVVGLGKQADVSMERMRQAAGTAVRTAQGLKATSLALTVFGAGAGRLDVESASSAVTEGAWLGNYRFHTRKTKDPSKTILSTIHILEKDRSRRTTVDRGMKLGMLLASATIHARDLVNESPYHLAPKDLKKDAERIAASHPDLSLKVLNRQAAKKLGMNAFLAVAQGSKNEPYFIHLSYRPKKLPKNAKRIVLIGKGITFDSGGLSIKPAQAMESMKCDMAGAAAVLGVFSVLADLHPRAEVHGLIAACENMPSGSAYRPGDIVQAMNGTTIEVLNTDAEGRVTLADALCYAKKLNPSALIDLATLTGACMVALGEEIIGVMTNNDALADKMFEASANSGEELWELPLFEGYDKLIDSKVADIKNIGGPWGGALTAGLFLKRFVDPETPWVHMDIAGPAFAEREYLSYVPYGGTGAGVRTLLHYLKHHM